MRNILLIFDIISNQFFSKNKYKNFIYNYSLVTFQALIDFIIVSLLSLLYRATLPLLSPNITQQLLLLCW